jgi:putative ABC transport system permease protein
MNFAAGLDTVSRHLRHAIRSLGRSPAFTLTVVLTLALAIGANSAVFSALCAVLLRPLPFPNGDELLRITQSRPGTAETFVAPVRLEEWNRMNETLQGITGYYSQDTSELSGELPERLKEAFVAPRFLAVLGAQPTLGRGFTAAEEHFGGPDAVIISDRFWRRRFGADPHIAGRTIRIGRSSISVIGVMPATFRFPDRDVDIWSVSAPDAPFAQSREATWFTAIARLKPGVSFNEARANLLNVQSDLGRQFPQTDARITPVVEPLKQTTIRSARSSLRILFASVSLLLLIACTNIAALILARSTNRQRETSIRFSLGASKSNVAANLFSEVFVLAVAGAILGLVLAFAASSIFRALAKNLPRVDEIGFNWSVVLYSLGCAVFVALFCGTPPAILGARRSLVESLAQGGRSQVAGRGRLPFVFVGIQIALAVTLLWGAGLLTRSFQQLTRVIPGFDPSNVLAFHISASWAETGDQPAAQRRTQRILDGLTAIPGVSSAASTMTLPGVATQYPAELASPESRPDADPAQKMIAESRWVSPAYFATMRIPLVAGEFCREEQGTATAMVNRSFVNRYFNGEAPLGRHITQPANRFVRPTVIRGVVADARESGLDREPGPVAYWCSGTMQPGTWFLARTAADPNSLTAAVRRKLRDVEPVRSIYDLAPLTTHISDGFAENRLRTILIAFFACAALSLACLGLYGTLSYLVSMRTREMALRLALGAMRAQVVRQVLKRGLAVAAIGCVTGLGLAAASARLLAGTLYGVTTTDTVTSTSVPAIILGVSLLASLIPAVRASRVEPIRALREE